MQEYIFYNNLDGKIYYVRWIKNDAKAQQFVDGNKSFPMSFALLSEVDGNYINHTTQKIDLTTTPLSLIKLAPQQLITINAETKQTRNRKLTACDWTQGQDSPLSDAKKTEWQTYRQALRDVTSQTPSDDVLSNINWPTKPS